MKDCCLFIQRDKKAQTRDRLSHGFIERGDTSEEFCGCSLILLQGMRSKYSSTKKKLKGKKKKKRHDEKGLPERNSNVAHSDLHKFSFPSVTTHARTTTLFKINSLSITRIISLCLSTCVRLPEIRAKSVCVGGWMRVMRWGGTCRGETDWH